MADTVIFDCNVLLSTSTVSEQVLIDSRQSMETEDFDLQVVTLDASETTTITGGTKGTTISTNLSDDDTIYATFGGVQYSFRSLLVLPGGVGDVIIENTQITEVRLQVVTVN